MHNLTLDRNGTAGEMDAKILIIDDGLARFLHVGKRSGGFMKKGTAYIKVVVLLGVLLAAGCLVPEKFASDATINKNRSYALTFKGTMVYLPYRMDKSKAPGKDSPEGLAARDAAMTDIEKELLTKEGDTFKKVKYVGNGVFDIEYAAAGELTEPYFFPSHETQLVRFVPEDDGTITIQGSGEEKNWAELKQFGVNVDGKFSLKTDATVVEHNARKTPGLFSKAYVWEIGPGNPPPHMILNVRD